VEQIRQILLKIILRKVRRENEVGGAAFPVASKLEAHPSVALALYDDPAPENVVFHSVLCPV
jgi:hypothetical protein